MIRRAVPVLLAACACATATVADAQTDATSARIPLPAGYQPEGIAAHGGSLYVGSISTGAVGRLDPESGAFKTIVPPADDASAIGVEATGKYLAVAAGELGAINVYRRGSENFVTGFSTQKKDTFVNDVARIGSTFYATDSRQKVLLTIKPGGKQTDGTKLVLRGVPYGKGLNLNGIVDYGEVLVAVHTTNGNLYRIDPRTGEADKIDLGGAKLKNGDGILRLQHTLYVVQNQDNRIQAVNLNDSATKGRLADTTTSEDFDVPTTLAHIGRRFFAVNARFGTDDPEHADYWVTRFF